MKNLNQILLEFKNNNPGVSDEGIILLRDEITELIKGIFAINKRQELTFGIKSIQDYCRDKDEGRLERDLEISDKLTKALE